jgi:carboxylesterase type B
MVWFHGGGLWSGESDDYEGSKLARRGDVVVVTLNYRIGALGFLSHPAINGEGHPFANYGIMDQQFALKWVQGNIAGFGGDPGNVTIFGQSGGGEPRFARGEETVPSRDQRERNAYRSDDTSDRAEAGSGIRRGRRMRRSERHVPAISKCRSNP